MKPPTSYYGGKQNLAKKLKELVPTEYTIYYEGFAGGLALLYALPIVKSETISDTDGRIVNFWQCCANPTLRSELAELVEMTPHSELLLRASSERIKHYVYHKPDVQAALDTWIAINLAFGNKLGSGFSYGISDAKKASSLSNLRTNFAQSAARLDRVQILQRDCREFANKFDRRDAFCYFDPPYLNADQGHYAGWKIDDLRSLLDVLSSFNRGKWMLSEYDSDILQEYVTRFGWNVYRKEVTSSASLKHNEPRSKRTELIVTNY